MKIGIVGNGIVGSTLKNWFENREGDSVAVYDILPNRRNASLEEATDADWVFICINLLDNAKSEASKEQLLRTIYKASTPNPIVLKTTVLPGTTAMLNSETQRAVIYNPEFLTEATPIHDFANPSIQIVGALPSEYDAAYSLLYNLPCVAQTFQRIVSPDEAEILKHTVASWLATKVSWFNQLHDAIGEEAYASVTDVLAHEPRIGASHMKVMQDSYRGWGGKCFTKDVPLFNEIARIPLLNEVIEYNSALLLQQESERV